MATTLPAAEVLPDVLARPATVLDDAQAVRTRSATAPSSIAMPPTEQDHEAEDRPTDAAAATDSIARVPITSVTPAGVRARLHVAALRLIARVGTRQARRNADPSLLPEGRLGGRDVPRRRETARLPVGRSLGPRARGSAVRAGRRTRAVDGARASGHLPPRLRSEHRLLVELLRVINGRRRRSSRTPICSRRCSATPG